MTPFSPIVVSTRRPISFFLPKRNFLFEKHLFEWRLSDDFVLTLSGAQVVIFRTKVRRLVLQKFVLMTLGIKVFAFVF